MNERQFRRYLDRDYSCLHCDTTETLVPGHRLGRGMGGSVERDVPSNVITMCSWLNNAIETNATIAKWAVERGWKLIDGQDPAETPLYDARTGTWFKLTDHYTRIEM